MSNYISIGQTEQKPGTLDKATDFFGSFFDFLRFRRGETAGGDFCLQPQNINNPACRPPESPLPKILLIGGIGVVVYLLARKKK